MPDHMQLQQLKWPEKDWSNMFLKGSETWKGYSVFKVITSEEFQIGTGTKLDQRRWLHCTG